MKVKEIEEYFIHPYSKQAVVTTRVFYVATRDIEEGEELICSYDEYFRLLHFDEIEDLTLPPAAADVAVALAPVVKPATRTYACQVTTLQECAKCKVQKECKVCR